MPAGNDAADRPNEIRITRHFRSPREQVFQQWVEAEQIAAWFAPVGFEVTRTELDARPGGRFRIEFSSKTQRVVEQGEFLGVEAPAKLVFTLTQQHGAETGPRTTVTVTFTEKNGLTEMRFHQTGFDSSRRSEENAEGWGECFDKQAANLAAAELRALFEAWFAASERRDIDAAMAPIAHDVVSYEHHSPLAYCGIDAVREVCQQGFDAVRGNFRWDIPDLKIIVQGDLAITWGLNRMHSEELGKPSTDIWSRGTRVFLRIDGRWQMIHQQVSFPFDPQTGSAKMDLTPATGDR